MGELVVPLEFLVIESSAYDLIIGVQTMIKLRARPDYYLMVLKVCFEGDSEILNYEYEREVGILLRTISLQMMSENRTTTMNQTKD